MDAKSDNIEIKLPFKAEYVSVARLAASGVAARVGFDIEAIEDIKVAIAEVCNKLVTAGSIMENSYTITFSIFPEKLKVVFTCKDEKFKYIFDSDESKLGISIIKALMDDVNLYEESGFYLSMSRALEGER